MYTKARFIRHAQLMAAAVSFSAWASCTADFPAGVLVCSESNECPRGMRCRVEEAASEGRCFPGSGSAERGVVTDLDPPDASPAATRDASVEDGATDAGVEASDAARPKAGAAGARAEPKAGSGGASDDEPQAGAGGQSTPEAGSGGSPDEEPEAGSGGQSTPEAGSGGGPVAPPAPCEDPARECDPSDADTADEACGLCQAGLRTHTRLCNPSSCRWEPWSSWSACTDPAVCMPNTSEPRTVSCAGCGSKTQTRTCSAKTCSYGAWTDASSCSWCDACGELVFCDTPDDIAANRGTWCRPQNGCNRDQAWGRCLEILDQESCRLHEPRYIGP